MKEIRVGVVGLGSRGLHWIYLLQQIAGYRITALCDRIEALLKRALLRVKNPSEVATYTSYEDILADPRVDAIALCVRCKEQGAMAAQALEAGKHVNSEVPAAHKIEDCWRIVTAVERTGLVYQLAEQVRYAGFVEAWRKLISKGVIGHVIYCEGQYFHFYTPLVAFQDFETGKLYSIEEARKRRNLHPTWLCYMPPIHYLPHELSPILKMLDDRVVEVTAMSTQPPSHSYPELVHVPDFQVALMKTEKGAILRMATSFTQKFVPYHHWYQVLGTRGCLEWKKSNFERPRMWLNYLQMHDYAEVDWRYERTDAPAEARGSGHGDLDYYVHIAFRDAVLRVRPLEFDVYKAMDTAAPAILAAESIAEGTKLLKVPDFRPNDERSLGEMPKKIH
ncbi:TPA: Gfo/Idh/MocA family oxidoreductase [Candidatus Bathyarchaeota archaeon]|nr:Gfo/Idh/MocA family oxidoreductase [Candidatus Bathyarchaeota archaeon]